MLSLKYKMYEKTSLNLSIHNSKYLLLVHGKLLTLGPFLIQMRGVISRPHLILPSCANVRVIPRCREFERHQVVGRFVHVVKSAIEWGHAQVLYHWRRHQIPCEIVILEVERAYEAGALYLVNAAESGRVHLASRVVAESREMVKGIDADYFACVDHRRGVSS